jgi:hypothetical protein
MKPMELLRCHIELLTQLVDLLARNHVETYMYNSFKPCGHINKTSGPTYILSRPTCKLTDGFIHRHNGHTCNPTNLFTDPMDILANLMDLFAKRMELLGPIVIIIELVNTI